MTEQKNDEPDVDNSRERMDLTRCSRCGRTGTLTCLSAGNTCVVVEPCDEARAEALAQVQAMEEARRG